MRRRIAGIYGLLAIINVGAWIWAVIAFRAQPLLLSTGLLAYGFGLRHAVDADHIAAIDNVTRKLMQAGRRPVSIGFFFAIGHSTVVLLATAAVAATAATLQGRFEAWKGLGGVISTSVSASFLFLVAAMNIVILRGIWQTFRRVRQGGDYADDALDPMLNRSGPLTRLFHPAFRLVSASWHMFPLGFLFGLGFDTATEVSLLGVSAAEAAKGISTWSIMVFPALFAAGMSLVDTTDGVLMLGAYEWAFVRPVRKLYYNLTITLVSILVALLIGGIEALGLIEGRLGLTGPLWNFIGRLNGNFGTLGFAIIGVFVVSWAVSALVYRIKGYDRLDHARLDPASLD
jgi:high-affinity nickel-transport protein